MSAIPKSDPNVLEELEMLRLEYRSSLSVTSDPEEKYRLYRMIQELNACIDRMRQQAL